VNFLAHLHLSGDDPEVLVGNLMGDFVKGPLGGRYPARITVGLELHRRIDAFASHHEHFIHSKRRLDPAFGHYRGVLVDLFYDHFLAVTWEKYAVEPLDGFIARAAALARSRAAILPERLAQLLPAIFGDWLPVYAEVEGIDRVLRRMAVRVGRGNPLAAGADELCRCYEGLREDFGRFYPELRVVSAVFLDAAAERLAPGDHS